MTVPQWYFDKIREGAARRGIEFAVTLEDTMLLFDGTCQLTGVPIGFGGDPRSSDTSASLDRLNSMAGYVLGNVAWVHKHINLAKGSFDRDDFISMCCAVAAFAGNTGAWQIARPRQFSGSMGGKARSLIMPEAERRLAARKAARVRWSKPRIGRPPKLSEGQP